MTEDLSCAQADALRHFGSGQRHMKRALEAAWACGQSLLDVKKQLAHGEFRAWAAGCEIGYPRAVRFMRLRKSYAFTDLQNFNSVHAALDALRPARADSAKLTPSDKRELEADGLRREAEDARAQLANLQAEIARREAEIARRERAWVANGHDLAELHSVRDRVIEGRRQILTLKGKLEALEDEGTRLRQTNQALKRLLRHVKAA